MAGKEDIEQLPLDDGVTNQSSSESKPENESTFNSELTGWNSILSIRTFIMNTHVKGNAIKREQEF